jgi:HEAT repeat protein
VLISKSAADMFGRSRRRLLTFSLPLTVLLLGGGYLALRSLGPRPTVEITQRLRPDEALAARRAAQTLLVESLTVPAPGLRSVVVIALGQSHDPELRPQLEPLLSTAPPELAAQVATALAQLGDRAALPALRALLDRTPSGALRIATAAALEQLGDPTASQIIHQALAGSDELARLKAAILLSRRGDETARAILTSAARDPRLPEEAAVTLLAHLTAADDDAARKQLQSRMGGSARREIQLLAAAKLAQVHDEHGRAFLRQVVGQHGAEQLPAARLLAAPDESAGLELLRRVMSDGQATLPERLLAIAGVSDAGRLLDVRPLHALLSPQTALPLRLAAAAAIIHLTDGEPGTLSDQSFGWARLAASDSDWVVRESAALVLGETPQRQALTLLSGLAKDSDAKVRQAALRALAQRSDPSTLPLLQQQVEDSDPEVRLEALRALLQLTQLLVQKGSAELLAGLTSGLKSVTDRGRPEEQLLGRLILVGAGDRGQSQALHRFLAASDPALRRLLIDNAGRDVELLRSALNDSSFELRLLAARRLAALHDSQALPVLRAAMAEGGLLALQAYPALRQLGEAIGRPAELRHDGQLAGALLPVAQRIGQIEALIGLPTAEALPSLRQAVRDLDPRVRHRVAEVAAQLPLTDGQPAGAEVLRLLLDDADPAVHAHAAALLARLLAPAVVVATSAPPDPPTAPPPPIPAAASATDLAPTPTAPPTANLADSPPAADAAADPPIKELAKNGARSLANGDFGRATQLLERAQRLCSHEHRASPLCSELSIDISYHLGRAHEEQHNLARAMTEYQAAMKAAAAAGKTQSPLASEAQEAVVRLVPQLGVVILPKPTKKGCRELPVWMEPGPQEIQVNGHSEQIEVRAHETLRVGRCP